MLSLFARFFPNLLWIFDFAETPKLPSTHVQLCSEVPLWCSESPFSVPRLGESQLLSTKHLPCSSAFALLYSSFLNIFSPSDLLLLTLLNLCPDLYLMLPWNIIHRKHLAVPCCMGHSFSGLALFHSASFWHKACRSHLTDLSPLQIQIIHLSALLRLPWFPPCPLAPSWLPWGQGHLSGLLFSPSPCFVSHTP